MTPPVLLVPGFLDSPASFHVLARRLEAAGFETHTVRLSPRLATCSLHHFARQLAASADAFEEVDVVGFSMGGLVARVWAQQHGGHHRVRRLVTLATPHGGSHWARALPQQATREMRPGSDLLRELDADTGTLADVEVASLWTPYDATVIPGSSGAWSAGESASVPVKAHRLMLYDAGVADRVVAFLRHGALAVAEGEG